MSCEKNQIAIMENKQFFRKTGEESSDEKFINKVLDERLVLIEAGWNNDYFTKSRFLFREDIKKFKELKEKGVQEEKSLRDQTFPKIFNKKNTQYSFILSSWFKQL